MSMTIPLADNATKEIKNTLNVHALWVRGGFKISETNTSGSLLRFRDELAGEFIESTLLHNDAAPSSDVAFGIAITVDGIVATASGVAMDWLTASPWFRVLAHIQKPRRLPSALEQRLEEFSQLQEGWDSYSARPISRDAIEKAKTTILKAVSGEIGLPKPFVTPTSAGGVGLEWTLESGKELLLEISPTGELSYLLVTPRPDGGETEIEDVIDDPTEIDELFRSLNE